MPNRLANENSPYLLQHADNPVNWYPWGEEALNCARQEDKPIFLSIGYAACHWCHVMAHESFEDLETADLMNQGFVNIKVDREERPDLDHIYMQAVVSMTGQGGWPLSVFLTPDGKPFFGGTYFPPQPRYKMPSFKQILDVIHRLWTGDRAKIFESSQMLYCLILDQQKQLISPSELKPESLEKAFTILKQDYDWQGGGWGKAPKFPQPMTIEFLLRLAIRGNGEALRISEHALQAMAKGGMYDVIGGGFARYSTDNHWLVPHFEKMLYDNAQLARVYLHAFLITGNSFYRNICEETLDFVINELSHPLGGFYSSLDADSAGEEGAYYVWTPQEVREALEDRREADFILQVYGVTETGNFDGKNLLRKSIDDSQLAKLCQLSPQQIPGYLKAINKRLYQHRLKRIRPATDDKVLVAWNALMLSAFSEAGRYLKDKRYLQVAIRNADFILKNMWKDGHLYRSWRSGQARHNAYLEDYTALILALITLYQSNPQERWFKAAEQLTNVMLDHFRDPKGGFFDTSDDHEALLLRPKDLQDNATPSGNALAAQVLLLMSSYNYRTDWLTNAKSVLSSMQDLAVRYPLAFAQWLNAMDFYLFPDYEVVILGDPEDIQTEALISILWKKYRPNLITAISAYPPLKTSPELVQDRHLINKKPTAFVCKKFVCKMPVNTPVELENLLATPYG